MMRRVLRQRASGLAFVAARAQSEAQIIRPVHKFEQFVRPENEEYVQELLKKFAENPNSVDSGWWPVLEALDQKRALPDVPLVKGFSRPKGGGPINEADETRIDNLKFTWMVRSFEQKGHLVAKLDPLGLYDADLSSVVPPELQPSFFGFTEAEMDKTFRLKRDEKGFTDGPTTVTLREVINELQSVYCANIGFEFTHLRSQEEQTWLRERILHPPAPRRTQSELLRELVHAEGFEKLLANKFTTAKRFGSEGAESVIPMLRVLLEESADAGFDSAIFSMAHRGRLNILHNVLQKDLDTILCEFQYLTTPGNTNNLGDVKYHLGHEATIEVRGRKMDVRMLANPSHLECVQPVSQGVVKARQTTAGNQQTAALHVTLHGDAAYSGQGVCFETMAMAELASFDVGGTIHIITNNQVGFTTNPAQSRSAAYCSDLAKLNSCPVFHVNGDCPEDVIRVAQIATAYRATFKRDVIIDFVCYRRNGHNETDEPRFTQPLMYKTIDAHGTPSDVYARKLNVAADVVKQMKSESMETYRKAFNAWESKIGTAYVEKKWVDPVLPEYPETAEIKVLQETGVTPDTLRNLGAHLAGIPENFTLHKLVLPIIKKRGQSYATGTGIEWAAAEQLALASLITTGHGVRLSGQDIERATFSQRHYNLHDFNNGDKYNSLTTLPNVPANTPVQIHNSLLSEFAVSAFELGYSMQRPNDLVMWEAQFGDFANGAQIVWDNFLSGMEVKWGDKCGLVISLPHGYDGQGPEHSSGRLERFLQLEGSDDVVPADFEKPGVSHYHLMESRICNGNWQVAYATTAANYFHLLRRQVCRDFRKPLINFFSKQNLRLEEAKSSFDEMAPGTRFQPVLDTNVPKARRVLFCSGQVSIGLRAATKESDVAVVRLEQIAPFPWEQVAAVVDKYRAANPNVEFVWVQDEPRNMGAWNYIRPRFRNLLVQRGYSLKEAASMRYIGRAANGSPATGYGFIHDREQKQIIAEALAK